MWDKKKRLWRICAACYQRFPADRAQCPDCGGFEYTQCPVFVSEAEIEGAKQELLEVYYRKGRK